VRNVFHESVNGNGVVKQIGNTTLGGPAVVPTVVTTSVEDMRAVGHEGMDLDVAADDGARSDSSIRGNNNNRSNSNSKPHLSL